MVYNYTVNGGALQWCNWAGMLIFFNVFYIRMAYYDAKPMPKSTMPVTTFDGIILMALHVYNVSSTNTNKQKL